MSDAPGHLWRQVSTHPPTGASMASDTIQLVRDNGNQVPNKSWEVQLFENWTAEQIPVELDLISEYTGNTRFVAIFKGSNKHYFAIPAKAGHSYRRTVILDRANGQLLYRLSDLTTGMQESFPLPAPTGFSYQITDVERGTEWHNLVSNTTFPTRWTLSLGPVSFTGPITTPTTTPTMMQPVVTQGTPPGMSTQVPDIVILGGFILLALVVANIFWH